SSPPSTTTARAPNLASWTRTEGPNEFANPTGSGLGSPRMTLDGVGVELRLVHLRPADEAVGRTRYQEHAVGETRAPVDVWVANRNVGCVRDHALDEPSRARGADEAGVEGREASRRMRVAVVDGLRAVLADALRCEFESEAPKSRQVPFGEVAG